MNDTPHGSAAVTTTSERHLPLPVLIEQQNIKLLEREPIPEEKKKQPTTPKGNGGINPQRSKRR